MPEDTAQDKSIGQRELEMVADALIEMFGDDAASMAMSRAAECQQKGESEGREFWTRLAQVIQEALDRRSGNVSSQT